MLDFRVVAESVGIENVNEQANVAQWLVAHDLAEWRAVGGQIGISSAGVHSVEDEEREFTSLSVVEIREVEALLTEIRRACELNEVTVHDEDRAVFDAELATIEAQDKSPSAKRKVVGVALREHLSKGHLRRRARDNAESALVEIRSRGRSAEHSVRSVPAYWGTLVTQGALRVLRPHSACEHARSTGRPSFPGHSCVFVPHGWARSRDPRNSSASRRL